MVWMEREKGVSVKELAERLHEKTLLDDGSLIKRREYVEV
jgi:hypothetical protein